MTLNPDGCIPSGGQIFSKGGNLFVHIEASKFLPKHYPGVFRVAFDSGDTSECEVGKQNVQACQYFAVQVGMFFNQPLRTSDTAEPRA